MSLTAAGSAQGVAAGGPLRLVPFSFWLQTRLPASLVALHQAMADQLVAQGDPGAEPLRWAITGADPRRGLRLEGIAVSQPTSPADAPGGQAAASDPTPTAACSFGRDTVPRDAGLDAADLLS